MTINYLLIGLVIAWTFLLPIASPWAGQKPRQAQPINMQAIFQGYSRSASAVLFRSDASLLAVAECVAEDAKGRCTSATVRVWNKGTGALLTTLSGHTGDVTDMAFSPDGNYLITSGGYHDRTAKVWDVGSWKLVATLRGHLGPISSVAFSPDGKLLATGGEYHDHTVKVWLTSTWTLLGTLRGHTDWVKCLAFSPDGKSLASGSRDTTVKVWDTARGKPLSTLQRNSEVYWVGFSQDGQELASLTGGGTSDAMYVWDTTSWQLRASRKIPGSPVEVALSPDWQYAVTSSLELWVWDAGRWKFLAVAANPGWITGKAFSPDGRWLVTVGKTGTVRLWNTVRWRHLAASPYTGHFGAITTVVFSPDGKRLASASSDRTVKLWDVTTGNLLRTLQDGGSFHSVAFSPDGKTLASGSRDKVKLWDATRGRLVSSLNGHSHIVTTVTFSQDGKRLISGSFDRTVKVWAMPAGHLVDTRSEVSRHYDPPIVFGRQGQYMASIHRAYTRSNEMVQQRIARVVRERVDATVDVVDMVGWKHLTTLRGFTGAVSSVAFSPDGRWLASGECETRDPSLDLIYCESDEHGAAENRVGTLKVWNTANGRLQVSLKANAGYILSVAFSADGKLLASGNEDATTRVWDTAKWRLLATLRGHTDSIKAVAFSLDGKILASVGSDIKLWDTARWKLLATLGAPATFN